MVGPVIALVVVILWVIAPIFFGAQVASRRARSSIGGALLGLFLGWLGVGIVLLLGTAPVGTGRTTGDTNLAAASTSVPNPTTWAAPAVFVCAIVVALLAGLNGGERIQVHWGPVTGTSSLALVIVVATALGLLLAASVAMARSRGSAFAVGSAGLIAAALLWLVMANTRSARVEWLVASGTPRIAAVIVVAAVVGVLGGGGVWAMMAASRRRYREALSVT